MSPRPYRYRRLLGRLGCERGQSVVEFALVVPLFLALVCSIVEFSRLYYVRLTIRDITLEATRFAVTGRNLNDPTTGKALTRAASIRRLVNEKAEDLRVSVDSIRVNPADGGGPGQVVQVRVFYQYGFTLAPLRELLPGSPIYFSVGTTMKNEPVLN